MYITMMGMFLQERAGESMTSELEWIEFHENIFTFLKLTVLVATYVFRAGTRARVDGTVGIQEYVT